ncbi:Delta2-dienoyl-CoA-isomerase [Pluteus cervinus]|uniref:Delta2-dienoyl-CoA-isomerase n=1 Tax=Pluteus cervinus TaxID=181527 RepID=A0ACD3A7I0_9AGAR|nr:Delta2-dienoyl-CoA-isomerase [Pluteus cervinus]
MSTSWIKVSEPIPHVFHVELARGPVNAFSNEFTRQYSEVFDRLGGLRLDGPTPPDVRAVVLSSAIPKLFTAGLDLSEAANIDTLTGAGADGARSSLDLRQYILEFQEAIGKPAKCPFPVIAAVHGPVVGLGMDIISACDVRYAAEDAQFSIKEVDIGLAADIGTLAYLPKTVGNASLAHELAYTARMFSAAEAETLGLVSKVVKGSQEDVVQAALALGKVIASKSPVAITGTKRLLAHARDHSVAESLEYTSLWNSAMLMTRDMAECLGATKGKRLPQFAGLKPIFSKL